MSLAPILLAIFSAPTPPILDYFEGEVVGLADGDTFTVLWTDPAGRKHPIEVRPHKIDCPEAYQAFGRKAKEFTSGLIFRKVVKVTRAQKNDSRGRIVARVELPDGRLLNNEMVRAGFAWVDERYARGDGALNRLEEEARVARRGLWIDLGTDSPPIPPWEFRKRGDPNASGPVIGNTGSRVYHRPGCFNGERIGVKNRVEFPSAKAAEQGGYRPGKDCHKEP